MECLGLLLGPSQGLDDLALLLFGGTGPHSGPQQRDHLPPLLLFLPGLLQFGTSFQEMDAMTGRCQTTKGVWLAKAPKIDEVCTLILDLEGSDGRERGEDDTNFERQSALFALAVADVLLINVWCHDIGREQGSGKPLMKTIFQVCVGGGASRCVVRGTEQG